MTHEHRQQPVFVQIRVRSEGHLLEFRVGNQNQVEMAPIGASTFLQSFAHFDLANDLLAEMI